VAKDGTNRGGRRVRAGAKPEPLREKLAAGKPATRLADPEGFEGPVRRPTLDRVICAGVRALCALRAGDLEVRPA